MTNFHNMRWNAKRHVSTMGKPYCHDQIHIQRERYHRMMNDGNAHHATLAYYAIEAAKERIQELNTAKQWILSDTDLQMLALPTVYNDKEVQAYEWRVQQRRIVADRMDVRIENVKILYRG